MRELKVESAGEGFSTPFLSAIAQDSAQDGDRRGRRYVAGRDKPLTLNPPVQGDAGSKAQGIVDGRVFSGAARGRSGAAEDQ